MRRVLAIEAVQYLFWPTYFLKSDYSETRAAMEVQYLFLGQFTF